MLHDNDEVDQANNGVLMELTILDEKILLGGKHALAASGSQWRGLWAIQILQ